MPKRPGWVAQWVMPIERCQWRYGGFKEGLRVLFGMRAKDMHEAEPTYYLKSAKMFYLVLRGKAPTPEELAKFDEFLKYRWNRKTEYWEMPEGWVSPAVPWWREA